MSYIHGTIEKINKYITYKVPGSKCSVNVICCYYSTTEWAFTVFKSYMERENTC